MASGTDDREWETAADENADRIIFDTPGDQFIGTYEGKEDIDVGEDEPATYLKFSGEDGHPYMTSANYKLNQVFDKIEPGKVCRITYVKPIDTGQPTPMKDFRVEVAR